MDQFKPLKLNVRRPHIVQTAQPSLDETSIPPKAAPETTNDFKTLFSTNEVLIENQRPTLSRSNEPISNARREAIQTETVHTLIQQNEDLSVRFNAQLRRASQLEIKIQKLEDAYEMTVRQNDCLAHETEVLREKMQRTEKLFLEAHAQRDEVQKTFAELYARSRESDATSKSSIENLEKKLKQLSNFRRRIRDHIKPALKLARERERLFDRQLSSLRTEVDAAKRAAIDLSQKRDQERVAKAELEAQFHLDLGRLAEEYESKLSLQSGELIQLRSEALRVREANRELSSKLEATEDERIRFQNESIREARYRETAESEIVKLNESRAEESAAQRLNIQSLEIEVQNLRALLKASQTRVTEIGTERAKLANELEDQKNVLTQTSKTLEATSEREAKASRLNVELSRSLKDVREELANLKIESLANRIPGAEVQDPQAPIESSSLHHTQNQHEPNPPKQASPQLAPQTSPAVRIQQMLSDIEKTQYRPHDWIEPGQNQSGQDDEQFEMIQSEDFELKTLSDFEFVTDVADSSDPTNSELS